MPKSKSSISKRPLIALVSERAGISEAVVTDVLAALKETVLELVTRDIAVNWTGFGKFRRALRQGHPVNFGKDPDRRKENYYVFQFAPSEVAKRRIRGHEQ